MAKLMHLRKQSIKKEEEIQFFQIDQVEFNSEPLNVICPACLSKVETKVTYTPGLFTYLVCFGFTSFGCVCGCCLLPFFNPKFKDIHHTCPRCNTYLGRWKKI